MVKKKYMVNKSTYKKRAQSFRVSLESIIILEKLAKKYYRTASFMLDEAIIEKGEKEGMIVTSEEIEQKHKEFENKDEKKKINFNIF